MIRQWYATLSMSVEGWCGPRRHEKQPTYVKVWPYCWKSRRLVCLPDCQKLLPRLLLRFDCILPMSSWCRYLSAIRKLTTRSSRC